MTQIKMRMPRITNAANKKGTPLPSFIRDSWHSSFIRRFGLHIIVFSYLPILTFATNNATGQPQNLTDFVNNFIGVLNVVVPIAAFLGFFGFLTGVLKYVGAGGDEERLGKAKQLIIYGLVGLLIIFSFWGIAKLIAKTYLGV